jgi:hypothetical protein
VHSMACPVFWTLVASTFVACGPCDAKVTDTTSLTGETCESIASGEADCLDVCREFATSRTYVSCELEQRPDCTNALLRCVTDENGCK